MDTQNGTDLNSWVKNIVVGGCDSPDRPFMVHHGEAPAEQLVASGLPGDA